MIASDNLLRLSPEQYLAFEKEAETRHEYYDGSIVAMAGGTPTHSLLIANTTIALGIALRGKPCRVYSGDLKVSAGRHYLYPDVSVVCGQANAVQNVMQNPTLVVEILSATTETRDRGVKWVGYQANTTLQAYVLVSQNTPQVEMFTRQADNSWRYTRVAGLDAVLTLDEPACTMSLTDLYDGVEFDSDTPAL